MTITKMKNGHFRIREMKDKKLISFYLDHKPTKKEAEEIISTKRNELEKFENKKKKKTLIECCEVYIDSKSEVLSPSTIFGYTKMIKYLLKNYEIMEKDISELNQLELQKFINKYSSNHSPKSVRNVWGLIRVVLEMFIPNFYVKITLPQKIKNEPYIPTDEDIKLLLKHTKNTEYDIPIKLALMGLRRSEIMGLDVNTDIKDGEIHIHQAKVPSLYGLKIKTTKTTDSTRTIRVSKSLTDQIKKKGYVFNGTSDMITKYLINLHKNLNVKHFSLHKLRHYFATMQHYLGVPDQAIMLSGGWKNKGTLNNIYQHSIKEKDYSNLIISHIGELE